MGTKSRESIYGASVRAAAERSAEVRKDADRLAVGAWNKRVLGFQGPAQPSPASDDAVAGQASLRGKSRAEHARLGSAGGPRQGTRMLNRFATPNVACSFVSSAIF